MTATVAEQADLRSLPDDELLALYQVGDDAEQAAALAEAARRDRAERARKVRQATHAEWYDAAFAQYLAAEAECRGHMFSAHGKEHGPADAFSLWRMPERQALKHASEDLQNHWLDHPRLTFAEYKRQLAAAKRQARDERDLARGAAGTTPEPEPAPEPVTEWERVPGGAVRPVSVPLGSVSVSAWGAMDAAGTVTVHPSRQRAEAFLAPAPEPEPMPDLSAMTPGALLDYLTHQAKRRGERMAILRDRAAALASRNGD